MEAIIVAGALTMALVASLLANAILMGQLEVEKNRVAQVLEESKYWKSRCDWADNCEDPVSGRLKVISTEVQDGLYN